MVEASGPTEGQPEQDGDEPDDGEQPDPGAGDEVAGCVAGGEPEGPGTAEQPREPETTREPETVQEKVEAEYDFERFSPADMAEMTVEEWEAAFDPDSWITGPELLDRVEADLRSRVGRREVFAVVERTEVDGEERVLAYTDVAYALVAPDGSVEGEGAILADVEPVVALCSMEDYDVPEPPADAGLPHPDEIADGAGSLGDRLLLAVAGVQIVAGLLLLLAPIFVDLNPGGPGGGGGLLTTVAGLGFLFIGIVIGVLVANARLSGRFRAEEYRQRLVAAGVGSDERPRFLPGEGEWEGASAGEDGGVRDGEAADERDGEGTGAGASEADGEDGDGDATGSAGRPRAEDGTDEPS